MRKTDWVFEWDFLEGKTDLNAEDIFRHDLEHIRSCQWFEVRSHWALKTKVRSGEIVWVNGFSSFL